MFEALLVTRLKTLAANVYPLAAPLDYSTPAIVYNRISTVPLNELGGSADHAFVTYQIDIYDPSYLAAKTLAATIRADLVEWQDDDASFNWIGETDTIDQTTPKSLYRTMLTFIVFTEV